MSAQTFCPNCGSPRAAGARYCGSCGRDLEAPAAPLEAATIVAPQARSGGRGSILAWLVLALLIGVPIYAIMNSRSEPGGSGSAAGQTDPTERPTPTSTLPPWPEGWDFELCYAIDQLGDANGHILEASTKGEAFDFDGAIEEAEQAATDAGEASDAAAMVDLWPPAHSVAVYLGSAADEIERAANLMVLGMQLVDASVINEAITHQEKATYQIGRANTAAEALVAKYGGFC
jgi:hypothetical protein